MFVKGFEPELHLHALKILLLPLKEAEDLAYVPPLILIVVKPELDPEPLPFKSKLIVYALDPPKE